MNVTVTPLGLGCAQLGNLYRAMSDENAAATVARAWDDGIRYFDTAPHYGLGLSERRLGAALTGRPRAEYAVSTKVGRLLEPNPGGSSRRDEAGFDVPATLRRRWDFSADGVRRSLDESMARLGLDRVDLVYVHDPDDHFDDAVTGAVPALVSLREQGMIGAVGIGMNQAPMLAEFVRRGDVDAVMVAGRYTLLNQPALDELLPLCEERGVAVMAAGVFNGGILATPEPGTKYDYVDAPPELAEKAARIAAVCQRHGAELPQVAMALPAAHPAVASVVVGSQSPEQVAANVARARRPVPPELWYDLIDAGLLRQDTPVRTAA
ncbi:aldo/keto reductase [Amycolatopsis sp. CA-230715]|uniref:aldo/keto reductase n=1 Tax=Amycolatopsis sp. CA-230715 TaxID=2745196 RepID=UPI001C011E56|nr:aldo/keto reductase [Amycolatopsis sp. CA-230715]QWF78265.1 D-threo-aldose 1-dehydrogenase [Amycolatopsis sp. CA-230715]